jgi:hypothetical protein
MGGWKERLGWGIPRTDVVVDCRWGGGSGAISSIGSSMRLQGFGG